MKSFTPNQPAEVEFALTDATGALIVPTGLRTRVLDEEETVLQDWTALPVPDPAGAQSVTVPVIGALNILTPPAVRGIRVVELEVTSEDGTMVLSDTFMLQGSTALSFGTNTFLTYPGAQLLASNFVELQMAGWSASDRPEQERALIEAHQRILRLPIGIHFSNQQDVLSQDTEFTGLFGPALLRDLMPGQVSQLYPTFLTALKMAQLVEANEILGGDPIRAVRTAGLISNTTGESSQFFRSAKPLELPVCPRAMEFLQRWVRFRAVIGRG